MTIATPLTSSENPAYTIEIEDIAVGLALPDRKGFRFVAADPRFHLLDGSLFHHMCQIETAARRLLVANQEGADLATGGRRLFA